MVELAKIIVHKTTGHCLLRRRIPARAKKSCCVSVEFDDPVWDGLVKTVVFRGNGKKIAEFDGEIAVVPWEVLENPGPSLWFGIWGSDPDTGLQLPLIEVHIGTIEESTDPDADPGTDPTLPIWAQLKQDVEELKKGGAGGGGAQSDWNAAEGEPGHILNRTHWTEGGNVEILPETVLVNMGDGAAITAPFALAVGETYTVTWNGDVHECVAQGVINDGVELIILGDIGALDGNPTTGEPFVIARLPLEIDGIYGMVLPLDSSSSATVAIYGAGEIVHKLDNKYLDVDWLPGIDKKDILPLQTVETTTTTDQKYYFAYVPYNGAEFWGTEISVGKKITVEVNGHPYECVVFGDAMDGFLTSAGTVNLAFHSQIIVVSTIGSQTLTLRVYIPDHKKMPVEYLPDEVGTVKSVNGVAPDESGNVAIEIPGGTVKTVNGTAPDENGNVEITIPDSGGNVDHVVQDTPPEDTSVLWVDTTDNSNDGFQEAVNVALAQAKASGEFDGAPGKDYILTDDDKSEIADMVEVPEGSGGGIAVTGAKVGQTVKISAVDENGAPTAWDSVDFPSGGDSNDDLEITTETWEISEGVLSYVKTFDKPIKFLRLFGNNEGTGSSVALSIKIDDVLIVQNLTDMYRSNNGFVYLTLDTITGFITILYRGRDTEERITAGGNQITATTGVSAGGKLWRGIVRYTPDGHICIKRNFSKIEFVFNVATPKAVVYDIEIGR